MILVKIEIVCLTTVICYGIYCLSRSFKINSGVKHLSYFVLSPPAMFDDNRSTIPRSLHAVNTWRKHVFLLLQVRLFQRIKSL